MLAPVAGRSLATGIVGRQTVAAVGACEAAVADIQTLSVEGECPLSNSSCRKDNISDMSQETVSVPQNHSLKRKLSASADSYPHSGDNPSEMGGAQA